MSSSSLLYSCRIFWGVCPALQLQTLHQYLLLKYKNHTVSMNAIKYSWLKQQLYYLSATKSKPPQLLSSADPVLIQENVFWMSTLTKSTPNIKSWQCSFHFLMPCCFDMSKKAGGQSVTLVIPENSHITASPLFCFSSGTDVFVAF